MIQKALESVKRILVLTRGEVGRSNFAPDFMLSVRRIVGNHGLEVLDRIRVPVLLTRDATQLIVRVQLKVIYLDRSLKPFTRFVQLIPLLMNQAKIIMSRSVCRVERRGFQILLE